MTFRDLFEATIDDNDQLSGVQKFQYLRSLLTGDAASMISALTLSERNYTVAWETLIARFERPYLIVRSIIDEFMNVESVSPNLHNFRNVVNKFSEGLQLLKSQGDYADSKDPWVIYFMSNKLDRETNKAWAEYSANINEPSLDSFLTFLGERSSALEIFQPNSRVVPKEQAFEQIQSPRILNAFFVKRITLFINVLNSQNSVFKRVRNLFRTRLDAVTVSAKVTLSENASRLITVHHAVKGTTPCYTKQKIPKEIRFTQTQMKPLYLHFLMTMHNAQIPFICPIHRLLRTPQICQIPQMCRTLRMFRIL